MKIEYEVNDVVFLSVDYGGVMWRVRAVHRNGVTIDNSYGETVFAGFRKIEPTPRTVERAIILRGGA